METPLKLAFSTCPNDTFMFGAWVNGLVQGPQAELEVTLADIQELNLLAAQAKPDVVKVSFAAYAQLRDTYTLLDSGAALGRGVGPLLVAREPLKREDLAQAKIGIPGRNTTANLLLSFYAPEANKRQEMRFDQIMPAVQAGELDAGLIIHESRFTYPEYGLQKLVDLGDYWEEQTELPIPLGGILARTSLGPSRIQHLEKTLRDSISYAFTLPDKVMPYVRQHAQEMDEEVMRKHIDLYVNPYSISLEAEGRKAVKELVEVAEATPGRLD